MVSSTWVLPLGVNGYGAGLDVVDPRIAQSMGSSFRSGLLQLVVVPGADLSGLVEEDALAVPLR